MSTTTLSRSVIPVLGADSHDLPPVIVHTQKGASAYTLLRAEIFRELAALSPDGLDDFDKEAYEKMLTPLRDAISSERLDPYDAKVWKIRFGVRNSKFRPTYSELEKIVKDALGIKDEPPLTGAERAAYRHVTVPAAPPPDTSSARDRAKRNIERLIARTADRVHSHGPDVWRPAYESMPDPMQGIPAEIIPALLRQSEADLRATGKGLHPNDIRAHGAKLYKQGLAVIVTDAPEENAGEDPQMTELQTAIDVARCDIFLFLSSEFWTSWQAIRDELHNVPVSVINAALREGRAAQAWESQKTETGSEWKLL